MNRNYLRVMVAVTAAVLCVGVSAQAFEPVQADVRQVSGNITWINLKLGLLQVQRDTPPYVGQRAEFRINQDETRVTNPADSKFLTVRNLHPGQHVAIDVVEDKEGKIVQRIITDPRSGNVVYSEVRTTEVVNNDRSSDLVGPRGPAGPAGYTGERGLTGPQGVSGAAVMGERGAQGLAGPVGEQGFTGPRGPAGDVARGPIGEVGPSGPQGARGEVGQMGAQGESLAGYAGPMGATGPQGERGPTGDVGAVGPTTYGPSGPSGYAGAAGQQGVAGEQGSQGSATAGVAGLSGPSGASGAMGAEGAAGYRGAAGRVGYWVSFREFDFYSNESTLSAQDMNKVRDIAAYMRDNPSLKVGIDGAAVRSRDQAVNDRRVNAIRAALIDAGVSPSKISVGAIENRNLRRNGRIVVFFATA